MRLAKSLFTFAILCFAEHASGAWQNSNNPAVDGSVQTSAATPTTMYTLPSEKLQQSSALYKSRGALRIIAIVYHILVPLVLLQLGIAARYRSWAEASSRNTLFQTLVFVALLMTTITLLEAPLSVYQQSLNRKYKLSIESWYAWCIDIAKQQILWVIVLSAIAWGLFRMIRGSPSHWWLYTWLLASPLTVCLFFLSPMIIEPLFNDFEPLDRSNSQLVDSLERLAKRGGLSIPRDRVFLMKIGKKVNTLNAYVTGVGSSKRVVVWDNTAQKATSDEISFIFAHEMGHYVLHHVFIQMIAVLLGAFVGLFLLFHASGWTVLHFPNWRIRGLHDLAVLPVLLGIIYVLGFLAQPISNALSRQLEHNADIYGLEITHGVCADSQQSAVTALQKMGELSLAYPSPSLWVVFWSFHHPPISDRIIFAARYDPWSEGQPARYMSRIRGPQQTPSQ